jgi:uncharacterized membrane protein YhaH (DUF805 family)
MNPFPLSGRISPQRFALAVVLVYLLSFASQILLSGPAAAWMGLWLFVLAQAALIWVWIALHVQRLRDADRPSGLAFGIAGLYALAVILMVLVMAIIIATGGSSVAGREGGNAASLFALLYVLAILRADPSAAIDAWLVGFAALVLLPILISIGFSIWAATRLSAASAP